MGAHQILLAGFTHRASDDDLRFRPPSSCSLLHPEGASSHPPPARNPRG
jgi:hypothetical protein